METDPDAAPASPPRLTASPAWRVASGADRNVTPLRLRLLLEIDRTGSISAAAERCAIGQPSASMHLRTLERAIGQRLVIRNGRGRKLTAAGQIVASHAAKVLANLDGMRWAVDAFTEPSRCELTLAASCTASLVLIPPILRDFSERHPGVSMRIRTLPSQMVVREVARAAADVGIAGEVASTEPVVRRQILIDELVGIASPALLSPDGGSVSRTEFARNNLLLGAKGSSTRMIAERNLASVDSAVAGVRSARFAISVRRIVSEHVVA